MLKLITSALAVISRHWLNSLTPILESSPSVNFLQVLVAAGNLSINGNVTNIAHYDIDNDMYC